MSFRVYSGPVWQRHAIEAGPALPAEQPCSYTAVTGNQNMPLPVVCRGPQRAAWTTPAAGARQLGFHPTLGTRYQHGCPRRVMELSMMSSATRKKACSCARAIKRSSGVELGQCGFRWHCTYPTVQSHEDFSRAAAMQKPPDQRQKLTRCALRRTHSMHQPRMLACNASSGCTSCRTDRTRLSAVQWSFRASGCLSHAPCAGDAQNSSAALTGCTYLIAPQRSQRVQDGHAAVELAAWHVVVQHLHDGGYASSSNPHWLTCMCSGLHCRMDSVLAIVFAQTV